MIQDYNSLSIGQRDAISVILNSQASDADKDMQILKVLGFDPEVHDMFETGDAIEKAKFLLSPCPEQKIKSFQFNGYTFKVPSITDITYAQYVDLCSSSDNASLLKAILVPNGCKYGDIDIDFSNLPYPIAASVINPFMNSLQKSIKHSLASLVIPIKIKAIFCKRYRGKVRSVLTTAGSVLHSLSSTRFI